MDNTFIPELYKLNEIREVQFYQVPKVLCTNEFYKQMSSDAKLTYSILLDRMELSRKNNWINEKGEIYLIFTRQDLMNTLCVSKPTATKIFKELSDKKLIKEVRQGLNKPNIIYIYHLLKEKLDLSGTPKQQFPLDLADEQTSETDNNNSVTLENQRK